MATLIELVRLRLSVTGVPAWTALASNCWTEAAIAGFAVSLVDLALNGVEGTAALLTIGPPQAVLIAFAVPIVIGFLIAEAIVGSVRSHAAPGSAGR